jgi:FtsZ-binding cell division protein ZapB
MATTDIDHTVLDTLKAAGAWIVALIGALGAWWAWRTSILKVMGDRVTDLEGKVDKISESYASAQMRVAELVGENIALRHEVNRERREAESWKAKYLSRRERHEKDTGPREGVGLETPSDFDADDELAADRVEASGEIILRDEAAG